MKNKCIFSSVCFHTQNVIPLTIFLKSLYLHNIIPEIRPEYLKYYSQNIQFNVGRPLVSIHAYRFDSPWDKKGRTRPLYRRVRSKNGRNEGRNGVQPTISSYANYGHYLSSYGPFSLAMDNRRLGGDGRQGTSPENYIGRVRRRLLMKGWRLPA